MQTCIDLTTANRGRRRFGVPAAAMLLALLLGACSAESPLPTRPILVVDDFPKVVQEQIAAADQAVSDAPDDASANGAVGMILHAYTQRDWAEIYYRRASMLAPDEPKWAYLHGVILESMGRTTEALLTLQRTLALDPDYAPARLRVADLLMQSGESEAATTEYRALEAAYPDSARIQFSLGNLAIVRGDLDDGIRRLERAARMESPYGAAHFALIAAYRQRDMLEEAGKQSRLFEKYRGREPRWEDPILGRVTEHNQSNNGRMSRAQRYLSERRLNDAQRELDAVLASDADNANAHILLIVVHGALGNTEQAETHYEAALAIAPDMARLHGNMGVLRFKQKRFDEAAVAFGEAIRVDPEYVAAYVNLGRVREQQRRTADATALYRKAIELAPENREAHYLLGRRMEKLGWFDAAVDEYKATLEPKDAETALYMRALARAYTQLKRFDEAIVTLERAHTIARQFRQGAVVSAINSDILRVERQRDAELSTLGCNEFCAYY